MKRKKGGGGGGANWMDTYGDMVTLLLCFFVLLYSMSTISEENWKALVMSFNPDAALEIHATPGGDGPNADGDEAGGPIQAPAAASDDEETDELALAQAAIMQAIEDLYQQMKDYVEQENMQGQISVTREGGKVYISFSDSIFFAGNSPTLLPEAFPILDKVVEALDLALDSIDEVRVLGHTAQADPNRHNVVEVDRMLSSQRATNVVIYVQENSQLDPARLVSEGFGQWRPVATNETEEGRAQNRRVEMIISGRDLEAELSGDIQKYYTEDSAAEGSVTETG